MAEKTVCIFGGTGFVGSRLASRLIRDGWSLRVPTRYREGGRHLLVLPGAELIQADPHDPAELDRLLAGCSAAVNLVGILNEKGRSGEGFERAHTRFTRSVVDACRRNGVTRLLQMSALKANAERGPSHFLRTKGEAEAIVRAQDVNELAWTIFQPSVIFGQGDSFINRFAKLLAWMPVMPLARADARFAPVYVEDVAHAMARSLRDPAAAGETYQLCGPAVYSLQEIVEFTARTLQRRRLILPLPDAMARLQGRVMDFVPGKPFSTDNYLSLTVNSVCADNGFEKLGLRPQNMEVVVRRYLRGQTERKRLDDLRTHAGR